MDGCVQLKRAQADALVRACRQLDTLDDVGAIARSADALPVTGTSVTATKGNR